MYDLTDSEQAYKYDICENIYYFFEVTGFTKTEIAKATGIPRERLSRAANSQVELFSIQYLLNLEKILRTISLNKATHKDQSGNYWMYTDGHFYKQDECKFWVEYESTNRLSYDNIIMKYKLNSISAKNSYYFTNVQITFIADNPLYEDAANVNVIDDTITYQVNLAIDDYSDLKTKINESLNEGNPESLYSPFNILEILDIKTIK